MIIRTADSTKECFNVAFDCIITDPPFGIGFGRDTSSKGNHAYNRSKDNVLGGYVEIEKEDYLSFTRQWMGVASKQLTDGGSAFVFSGWNNLKDVLQAAEEVGWHTINHIIWKYNFGVYTRHKFVCSHYHLLYFCNNPKARQFFHRIPPNEKLKNGNSARYADMEDVWLINREYWRGTEKTPTKLPSELVEKIVSYSTKQGDRIYDPFSGSGQVPIIADRMGRYGYGQELNPQFVEFSVRRKA